MDLFEEFYSLITCNAYGAQHPDYQLQYSTDNSGFVVVDGEEGDHGIVKYIGPDGVLLATKTVLGGDSEEFEFTAVGKEVLQEMFFQMMQKRIRNM